MGWRKLGLRLVKPPLCYQEHKTWVGGGGDWMEGEGLASEHACMTHGHRQQCGDGQRESGRWVEAGKGGRELGYQ